MRAVRFLLLLLVGLAVGYVSCFIFDLSHVDAQGVGIFGTSATGTRINCSQITSPVQGQTFYFDQKTNTLQMYNGTAFAPVTATGFGTNLSPIGAAQLNTVNYLF